MTMKKQRRERLGFQLGKKREGRKKDKKQTLERLGFQLRKEEGKKEKG
jgi:hypothetical protein